VLNTYCILKVEQGVTLEHFCCTHVVASCQSGKANHTYPICDRTSWRRALQRLKRPGPRLANTPQDTHPMNLRTLRC